MVVRLKSSTYTHTDTREGITFISLAAGPGQEKELYVVSTAEPYAGSWNVRFDFDENPLSRLGKPKDYFSGNAIIIMGSAEEDSFRIEQKKRQEEAEEMRLATQRADSLRRVRKMAEVEANRIVTRGISVRAGWAIIINNTGQEVYGKHGEWTANFPEGKYERDFKTDRIYTISLPKRLSDKFSIQNKTDGQPKR